MYPTRVGFMRCSGAAGPSGCHHSAACAANLEISDGSTVDEELEEQIGLTGNLPTDVRKSCSRPRAGVPGNILMNEDSILALFYRLKCQGVRAET